MPQSETERPKSVEQWLAIESELKDGEEKEGCKCLPSVARRMDCIAHRRHTKTGKMEDGSHTSVERGWDILGMVTGQAHPSRG